MTLEDEMMQGYTDGLNPDTPEPSENRTHSYRHGFANGRDDKRGAPRAPANEIRKDAEKAQRLDLL